MKRIQFSEYLLNMDTFTLVRNGEMIPIGRRSLDLLVFLIENRDRFVSSETLRQMVWHGQKLSASAIPTCVRELRRLLRDHASSPRIIASKRERGYRFIAHAEFVHEATIGIDGASLRLPFVGRMRELEVLRGAYRAISSRMEGQLVVLRGEAGIGKSRIVEEFLRSIHGATRKYVLRCRGGEFSHPLSPWMDLLDKAELRDDAEKNTIEEDFDSAIEVAKLLRTCSTTDIGGAERSAMYSLWGAALRKIVGSSPLVLIFEDIHLGSPSSLHLIAWIAETLCDLPMMILATQRPSEASQEIRIGIEDVISVEHCVLIDVGPLGPNHLEEIIRPRFLQKMIDVPALLLSTGGNPSLVSLALTASRDPSDAVGERYFRNRGRSRGVDIATRLTSDLPLGAREVLMKASLVGSAFTASLISHVSETPLIEVERLLQPAVSARLLQEVCSEFKFCHPLLSDALRDMFDSAERKLFHVRIARHLQQAGGPVCAIATQMVQAMPHIEPEEAARYCTLAYDDAVFRLDFAEARRFAEEAVRLTRCNSRITTEERCGFLINLARSCFALGQRETARSILIDVADVVRSERIDCLLAECALVLSSDFASIDVGVHDVYLQMLIREALEVTPHSQKANRALLLSRLSLSMSWSDSYDERNKLARESLELALDSGEVCAVREALSAVTEMMHGPENAPGRLEVIERIDSLAPGCVDGVASLLNHTKRITALLEMGCLDQVASVNKAYAETANRTGQVHHCWYALTTDTMRSLMAGDMTLPADLEGYYRAVCATSEIPNIVQGYAVQRFFREVECGNGEAVAPLLRAMVERYPLVTSWRAALAWLYWDLRDVQSCERQLLYFNCQAVDSMRRQVGSGAGLAMLAEVLANVGSSAMQRQLFEVLEPIKERCATAGYGVLYLGAFARHAGVLANSIGRKRQAINLLEFAVEQEALRGAELWRGYALVDLSLVVASVKGGKAAARRVLDEAGRAGRAIRVPRLLRRVADAEERILR